MYVSKKARAHISKILAKDKSKELRKLVKHIYNEGCYTPVPSMLVQDHAISDGDGSVTYFGLYSFGPDWDKEDIDEYFEDKRVVLHYQFDCSGKLFTQYLHWHLNPCGLYSMVHHMCLDI